MQCTQSAMVLDILSSELGYAVPTSFPSRSVNGVEKHATEFAKEYLLYSLVRKAEPFSSKEEVPVQILRDSLTIFAEAEFRCQVINHHGRMYTPLYEEDKSLFQEAFRLAKTWISKVLMDVWPRWEDARYTSGASRHCSRARSLQSLKWAGFAERGKLSATTPALGIVHDYIAPEFGHHWSGLAYDIVDDSRFDFVAKTAKAVRFMAMEPEFNMLSQQCVGSAIRHGLLEYGINLNDQTINQDLARLGSVFRTRATLDQSSASDCIALKLLELLPERYKDMCIYTRTPYTTVQDHKYELQKIATMGNGFIFELQSLIFAGFSHACTTIAGGRECDIAVYGDDIIVSTCVAPTLMKVLDYYGLIPNLEKSYWEASDPFRESCGKHYYDGHDVTPFYIKGSLSRLENRFRAYNGLRYWSLRTGIDIPDTLKYILSLVDKKDRVVIPQTFSINAGFHFPVSRCTFPVRKRDLKKYGISASVRYHFRYLARGKVDVTEKLGDYTRLMDWFANPPIPLIEEKVWERFSHSVRRYWLCGVPREIRVYSSASPQSADMVWVSSSTGPG